MRREKVMGKKQQLMRWIAHEPATLINLICHRASRAVGLMTSHYHFLRLFEQCEVKITSLAHGGGSLCCFCAPPHQKMVSEIYESVRESAIAAKDPVAHYQG
jgi:hypothetical protein